MLDLTFCIDGIDAKTLGLYQQKRFAISPLKPIVRKLNIPGRNGDLIIDTGAYENRVASCKAFIMHKNVHDSISKVAEFLLASQNYKKLTLSDDPGRYWMARAITGPGIENRMDWVNPFNLKFDLCPEHWLESGNKTVTMSSKGPLTNPGTGVSKPVIILHGSGSGQLKVNSLTIDVVSFEDGLVIDCAEQNAYNGTENKNADIKAPEFPVLNPGDNNIEFTGGIVSIDIVPRWWDL